MVEFYVPGRRRRIAVSTRATSDFLVMVHRRHPAAPLAELREIITDKRKYILFPDAVSVLDAYIKAGYGALVPRWY